MKDAIKTACNIKDVGGPFLYCPNNVLIFLIQFCLHIFMELYLLHFFK